MLLSYHFNAFSINLNVQHVNGITRFDLVKIHAQLLGTIE